MEGVLEGREGRPRRGDRAVGPEEEEVEDKVEEEQGGGRRRGRRRTPLCLQLDGKGRKRSFKNRGREGERERGSEAKETRETERRLTEREEGVVGGRTP